MSGLIGSIRNHAGFGRHADHADFRLSYSGGYALGLGKIPGMLAVVVYAIPPVIRLTNLGIRLVDKDVIEAADAFGAGAWQKLVRVQLPLALPNIMAGINQTIMMALSMVVIASMIGVKGLGQPVLQAVTNQYFASASSMGWPSSA